MHALLPSIKNSSVLTVKKMRRIVIRASDVAAIIGKNQYKPRSEIFNDMWKRYSPETFTGKTKTDIAEEALGASVEARRVLASAVKVRANNSEEVQKIFETAKEALNADTSLTETQKSDVIEHMRSKVYTSHGTRSEAKTSDKVEVEEGGRLVSDHSFYNLPVCTIGSKNFVITGKIDRIEIKPDGSKTLIEIKNRTNRLFRRVVEYENIQVQVYLRMLGLLRARLVEEYNYQVMSHEIVRDEELWDNEIFPGVEEFCQELSVKIQDN